MPLSSEQKRRLENMLGKLDEAEINATLANERSFVNWIRNAAADIYNAIKNVISSLFDALRRIFT